MLRDGRKVKDIRELNGLPMLGWCLSAGSRIGLVLGSGLTPPGSSGVRFGDFLVCTSKIILVPLVRKALQ